MFAISPLNRIQPITITRGRTHSSLLLNGQSPRVLCTEECFADPLNFRGCERSTAESSENSVKEQHQFNCNIGVVIEVQTKNTGAVLSLTKSTTDNASVKAVDVNKVYDSFPRSNDIVASTASRHDSKITKIISAQRLSENHFQPLAPSIPSFRSFLARSRTSATLAVG